MKRKIKLLEDIEGKLYNYKKGEIFEEFYNVQGFNPNGTFTIVEKRGYIITLDTNQFEELL